MVYISQNKVTYIGYLMHLMRKGNGVQLNIYLHTHSELKVAFAWFFNIAYIKLNDMYKKII